MSRPMMNRIIFVLCLLPMIAEGQTHCIRGEKVLFSCRLSRSSKIASVCASADLTKTEGYLQYRFGIPGKLEFVYPPTKAATQDQFYWRAPRGIHELIFQSGDYYYTISTYNFGEEFGDEIPGGSHFGIITVEKQWGSGRGWSRKCATYPKGSFESLVGIPKDGDDLLP
ncbi:MAG: hypothetical protein LM550_17140 [Candidatus Contendobacter sp.]|nr:hypothetical protein [Candidatus Contendobacter sp.]